ncbi:MAG: efflux RND transporter periplasmic adaptor subunit [Limisphaerales bacterium]
METEAQEQNNQSVNPKRKWLKTWGWLAGGILLVGIILLVVLLVQDRAKLAAEAEPAFSVAVAKVVRTDLANQETWYAEFRPYQEVDLHAKVSGYVSAISVDFGDQVKEGQLLATIEVPELAADLEHALAIKERTFSDVKQAQAAYDEANEVATHLAAAAKLQPDLIATQDIDVAADKARHAEAALASANEQVREAEANVSKLRTMCSYTNIAAPFSGVITKRYADLGSLIQAGTTSSTQAEPLVRLSENYLLRLDFPVNISYVTRIKIGDSVAITVQGLEKTFPGKVTRFTRKVDSDTRTMNAEIEVPNPNLELVPGMYAWATWRFDHRPNTLAVPTEAVSHQTPPTVYVVTAENTIEERPVTVGLTTSTEVEVVAGLKENDLVMIGDRGRVTPGQKVTPKVVEQPKLAGTEGAY